MCLFLFGLHVLSTLFHRWLVSGCRRGAREPETNPGDQQSLRGFCPCQGLAAVLVSMGAQRAIIVLFVYILYGLWYVREVSRVGAIRPLSVQAVVPGVLLVCYCFSHAACILAGLSPATTCCATPFPPPPPRRQRALGAATCAGRHPHASGAYFAGMGPMPGGMRGAPET